LAKKFSELCPGHLDKEKDVVASPILHDTPGEMAQATDVKAWFNDECEAIPGKTMPNFVEVERNYPDTYKKFTSSSPDHVGEEIIFLGCACTSLKRIFSSSFGFARCV
jgi:nitrate reductase alpha subunit